MLGQLSSSYYGIQNVKDTGQSFINYRYYSPEVVGPVISERLYNQLKIDIEFAGDEIMVSVKKIDEELTRLK